VISLMSRGRNISLVLISFPSLVETFNRVTRRVPHVEQEHLILPEHPSCWAIKKLCSLSWTFPENSRRPGDSYFYLMFMIPEVLVNFAMKNLLKMFWQRRSKSITFINLLILKRRKSLRRKAILGWDEKLKYFDGS
jgi:hypothetical protein